MGAAPLLLRLILILVAVLAAASQGECRASTRVDR